MDVATAVTYAKYSPFRSPSWRWDLACEAADESRRGSRSRRRRQRPEDPVLAELTLFVRELRHSPDEAGKESVARRWPHPLAAQRLQEGGGLHRGEVEARLIAGQSDEEIASRTGWEPEVVSCFEQTFFNVRDRLGARDWLAYRAVGTGLRCGFAPGDLAGIWRAAAYGGGSVALEVVLAVTLGRPLPDWPVPGGCDSRYHTARLRLSAEMFVRSLLLPGYTDWEGLAAIDRERRRLDGDERGERESARLSVMAAVLDLAGGKRERRSRKNRSIMSVSNAAQVPIGAASAAAPGS
jgi:hypothetical protein